MPRNDGVGFYEDQGIFPSGPASAKCDPEQTLVVMNDRSSGCPVHGCELLTQREIFQGEFGLGFPERSEGENEHRQNEAESVRHPPMISRIGSDRKGCVWMEKCNDFGPDGVLANHRRSTPT